MEIPERVWIEYNIEFNSRIGLWPCLLHTFWEYCFNPCTVQLFYLFQKTNNKAEDESEDEKTCMTSTDDW